MDHIPSMRSVMTPFPHCVEAGDSLLVARTLMVRHDVRHLPVKEEGRLVGVLTDRDLKRALDPDLGLAPKDELFVRDVFVPNAYTVDTAAPLDGVLEEMVTQHMGSVLVTSHGRLAGIFTTTDACRILCGHLRALVPPRPGNSAA